MTHTLTPAMSLTTGPTAEPITNAEAKDHLRVDAATEDNLIETLITVAREQFELETGRVLMTQTWEQLFDYFPAEITLLRFPVQSITSIKYLDTDGTEQTLATTEYVVDIKSEPTRIVEEFGKDWPVTRDTVNAVTVTFVAGYVDAASVPESIKSAIKLLLSHLFENREAVVFGGSPVPLPLGYERLMAPHRSDFP